jgi:SAM-dependent methyltransferase
MQSEHKDSKARTFFDELWQAGDYWGLEGSDFERRRYAALLAMIDDRRYRHVIELGCGAGEFTRLLAPLADEVLALDVSAAAIERAQAHRPSLGTVAFRNENVMDFNLDDGAPWDLIVLTETIYYLGWLYSFFDIAWRASELLAATSPRGRLLLANTFGVIEDPLVRPWIIRTYRDLFVNVGYELEAEEVLRGEKSGVELKVLISLFQSPNK